MKPLSKVSKLSHLRTCGRRLHSVQGSIESKASAKWGILPLLSIFWAFGKRILLELQNW